MSRNYNSKIFVQKILRLNFLLSFYVAKISPKKFCCWTRGGIINGNGQIVIWTTSEFQWCLASSSLSSIITNEDIHHHVILVHTKVKNDRIPDQYIINKMVFIQMVGLSSIQMAFENQTIWHPTSFWPFKYQSSSSFRSLLNWPLAPLPTP